MCELCMRNMQVSENFERFATFSRASSVFISFFYFLRPFDDKILQGDILINIYTFKGRPRDCKSTWTEQSGNLKIATVKFSCRRSDQTLSDQAAERSLKNQNGLLMKSNALSQHSQLQTSIFSYATAWFRTMCRR